MVTERIHGETYKHKVADIEGYVDPTTAAQAVVAAHKIEADAHAAGVITNTPTGDIAAVTVQAAINELDSEKVSKAGSLTQITTRNHNDLQNLNVASAHPSASIDNTSTAYGRGLATTDNTVQKIADRVNTNGTPQFVTDKSKCTLLLDFKDGLVDKTRGIQPISYNTAVKGSDNFISSPDGNISATLKQFDGDEGLFGSGVAVEESRTNLLLQSDDLTSAAWTKNNCTVTLDRIENGQKIFKVVASSSSSFYIGQDIAYSAVGYTASSSLYNPMGKAITMNDEVVNFFLTYGATNKLTRISGAQTLTAGTRKIYIGISGATAGDYFYISQPQLEAGSFPTSYIATGATAVTRPAGKLEFNNANGYLFSPNNDNTISLWFNKKTPEIATFLYTWKNGGQTYAMFYIPDGRIHIYSVDNLSSIKEYDAPYTLNINTNYHIVIKTLNKSVSIYINSTLLTPGINNISDGIFADGASSLFYLGCTAIDTELCHGTISNFQIYNYALTDTEISNIYYAGLEGKPVICENALSNEQADRMSSPISADLLKTPFVTDKSKCSLLLDFKDGLTDKTRGINPIGFELANRWIDNFINDNSAKANMTNLSCSLRQFEGNEGMFGSGVAIEESRTNYFVLSEDLNSWNKTNCTVDLVGFENGQRIFKITSVAAGDVYLTQSITLTSKWTMSISGYNGTMPFELKPLVNGSWDGTLLPITTKKMTRASVTSDTDIATTGGFGTNATAAGQTWYVSQPQLEVGSFPTSYIATGLATATRPAGRLWYSSDIINKCRRAFTVATKFKIPVDFASGNKIVTIFDIRRGSPTSSIHLYYDTTYDTLNLYDYYSGYRVQISAPAFVAANANLWHDVSVVMDYEHNDFRIYLDGVSVAYSNADIEPTPEPFSYIGVGSYGDATPNELSVILSNFAVLSYALSEQEAKNIHESGLKGIPVICANAKRAKPTPYIMSDSLYFILQNSWGFSSTYPSKAVCLDDDGMVYLRGIMEKSGTVNANELIMTLPVGLRPALDNSYFNSYIVTARDSGAPANRIVRIYGTGEVYLMATGATIVNPSISLDGIAFINGK